MENFGESFKKKVGISKEQKKLDFIENNKNHILLTLQAFKNCKTNQKFAAYVLAKKCFFFMEDSCEDFHKKDHNFRIKAAEVLGI
jgi:hypothetical protein